MAQGNVILTSRRNPLRPLPFWCSISSQLMLLPSTGGRIEHAMKRAENRQTESDARRSVLMAAAQAGDRVAYETLLRDCVSFILGVARRLQYGPHVGELLRPCDKPRTRSLQRLIRQADRFHDALEIGRIEVACDERESLQRLQKWRQHGHDVVDHGLAHRAFLLLEQSGTGSCVPLMQPRGLEQFGAVGRVRRVDIDVKAAT